MKIILIGFMGSGKSCVAHKLGEKLNLKVIEMDKEIERKAGKTIPEIFSQDGETAFRQMEIDYAKDLRTSNNVVISSGGGVVMNKIIIDYLKANGGTVIFLETSFAVVERRIGKDTNTPLFQDKSKAKELYEFRQPLYKNYADKIINTDNKTIEDIANDIFLLFPASKYA